MSHWQRVAPSRSFILGTGAFFLFGLTFLVILVRGLFFFPADGNWAGLILVIVFVLLWTLFAWRLNRLGVYTTGQKVRIRTLFRTYTFPWTSIEKFEDRPATSGIGGRASHVLEVRAIWVTRKDGQAVQTPLAYRSKQSTAFLPRPGIQGHLERMSAGFAQSRPMGEVQKVAENSQLVASEQRCRDALRQLREALRNSRE